MFRAGSRYGGFRVLTAVSSDCRRLFRFPLLRTHSQGQTVATLSGNAAAGNVYRRWAACLGMTLALTAPQAGASLAEQKQAAADAATSSQQKTVAAGAHNASLSQQRELFLKAQAAYDKHQRASFLSLTEQLKDYPLYPYLRFLDLRSRVDISNAKEVQAFMHDFAGTRQAQYLHEQWLNELANSGHWQQLLDEYDTQLETDSLHCSYLMAQIKTGKQTAAFADMSKVWLSGASLPDSCDAVISLWQKAGGLTADLMWQRFELAMQVGNKGLATYLKKQMPAADQTWAELYLKVFNQPALLEQVSNFKLTSSREQDIVLQGMLRYLRQHPTDTQDLWQKYLARNQFDAAQRATVTSPLALQLAVRFDPDAAVWLQRALADRPSDDLRDWQVRVALRNNDWKQVLAVILQMPDDARNSVKWQYWQARALEAIGGEEHAAQAMQLYGQAAKERDFYGFLAADRIGVNYSLNYKPFPLPANAVADVSKQPGIQRAREFYLAGMVNEARREWRFTTKKFSTADQIAASNLALQWGWYGQSVMSVIASQERDDLQIRFPLVYQDLFSTHAKATNLDLNWVMALARQESAFMSDARSPAGAMGLLQLMPATAKNTARSIGLRYHKDELLTPEYNIRLGTAHLSDLLGEFGNNRILATAAYNAGAYRVNQWLADGGQDLPYDIWIETVPFRETRNYVQNVLAFSVIYGYRRGETSHRLLTKQEVACLCTK